MSLRHISVTVAQLRHMARIRAAFEDISEENISSLTHNQVAVTLCDFITRHTHDPELMRVISRAFDRAADEMERKPHG